ncbi:hypothetical protein [Microbacterium soli]|uniref:YtxH domain-containing protein n=1 Tax=Microbacterium soli TaxID=446075 RepID=A0ABP7N702_9MICO
MRGKVGLVVGLGVGYVLGTRAGRERYEQIKTQWLRVWHLDPVQRQVARAQDFAKTQAAAVPNALWRGVVKVVSSASDPDVVAPAPAVPDSTAAVQSAGAKNAKKKTSGAE